MKTVVSALILDHAPDYVAVAFAGQGEPMLHSDEEVHSDRRVVLAAIACLIAVEMFD